jgi:hypothetical protein
MRAKMVRLGRPGPAATQVTGATRDGTAGPRQVSWGDAARQGSSPVEYLDGAVAAIDPDTVAGVQAGGRVAAADDGGDA